MKIMMKKLLSRSLNSVFSVEQLFDEIKKTEDENIILDFSGIQFVALTFAQAYVASKKQCEKNITELNVSDKNKITLNIPAQNIHPYSEHSKTISTDGYFKQLSENKFYSEFQEYLSNNYSLINKEEIINFISYKPLLTELIKELTVIIRKSFEKNELSMEFIQDPEITDLKYLNIYIHSSEESFNKDWNTLKIINQDIRQLKLLDNSIKKCILVDLW